LAVAIEIADRDAGGGCSGQNGCRFAERWSTHIGRLCLPEAEGGDRQGAPDIICAHFIREDQFLAVRRLAIEGDAFAVGKRDARLPIIGVGSDKKFGVGNRAIRDHVTRPHGRQTLRRIDLEGDQLGAMGIHRVDGDAGCGEFHRWNRDGIARAIGDGTAVLRQADHR
jgi:hypothetical protein